MQRDKVLDELVWKGAHCMILAITHSEKENTREAKESQ